MAQKHSNASFRYVTIPTTSSATRPRTSSQTTLQPASRTLQAQRDPDLMTFCPSDVARELSPTARLTLKTFCTVVMPETDELAELEGLGLVVRAPETAYVEEVGSRPHVHVYLLPAGRAVLDAMVAELQASQARASSLASEPSEPPESTKVVLEPERMLVAVARMAHFIEALNSTGMGSGASSMLNDRRISESIRAARDALMKMPGVGYPERCSSCGRDAVTVVESVWFCESCNYSRGLGDVPRETSPSRSVGKEAEDLVDFEVTSVTIIYSDVDTLPTYCLEIEDVFGDSKNLKLKPYELDMPKLFRKRFMAQFQRMPKVPLDEEQWSRVVNHWLSTATETEE